MSFDGKGAFFGRQAAWRRRILRVAVRLGAAAAQLDSSERSVTFGALRVPHEPCRRVRRGAGSSLPWAALPSLSESFMVAEFLHVRECMMDRITLEMKRQWSTFDGEVLLQNLYIIASVRPWTLRMWVSSRHAPEVWGSGSVHPRGSDDTGAVAPAIQDDPTTQR